MRSAIFGSMLAFAGCIDSPTVIEPPAPDDTVDLDPTLNALTPAQLFNSKLDPRTLDTASATAMAQTWDNRMALTYAISCALAPDRRIQVVVGGIPHTFAGAIGLADSWTATPLTDAQRQVVSGCVLARLNEYGVSVNVAMQGASSALAASAASAAGYTVLEGAFFGSIFTGFPVYGGACSGTGTAPWSRQCAQPGPSGSGNCSLDYVGPCSEVCTFQNGYYVDCLGGNGVSYAEPTTTYLAP